MQNFRESAFAPSLLHACICRAVSSLWARELKSSGHFWRMARMRRDASSPRPCRPPVAVEPARPRLCCQGVEIPFLNVDLCPNIRPSPVRGQVQARPAPRSRFLPKRFRRRKRSCFLGTRLQSGRVSAVFPRRHRGQRTVRRCPSFLSGTVGRLSAKRSEFSASRLRRRNLKGRNKSSELPLTGRSDVVTNNLEKSGLRMYWSLQEVFRDNHDLHSSAPCSQSSS